MRREVFGSFCYLLTGLLIGEAKAGTSRASVFAPADYWPQRLSDLFCRHKVSGQALIHGSVDFASFDLRGLWIKDNTLWRIVWK